MNAKHTPGPWKTNGSVVYAQKNPGGMKWTIADVSGDLGPNVERENARLIAAAPELLAILKDVGDWLETHLELGHISAGTGNRDGDLVSQIRAAIAKAEGREP